MDKIIIFPGGPTFRIFHNRARGVFFDFPQAGYKNTLITRKHAAEIIRRLRGA